MGCLDGEAFTEVLDGGGAGADDVLRAAGAYDVRAQKVTILLGFGLENRSIMITRIVKIYLLPTSKNVSFSLESFWLRFKQLFEL